MPLLCFLVLFLISFSSPLLPLSVHLVLISLQYLSLRLSLLYLRAILHCLKTCSGLFYVIYLCLPVFFTLRCFVLDVHCFLRLFRRQARSVSSCYFSVSSLSSPVLLVSHCLCRLSLRLLLRVVSFPCHPSFPLVFLSRCLILFFPSLPIFLSSFLSFSYFPSLLPSPAPSPDQRPPSLSFFSTLSFFPTLPFRSLLTPEGIVEKEHVEVTLEG